MTRHYITQPDRHIQTGHPHNSNSEHLETLQMRIEEGDLDVEMIADYIMFCELGGQPDEMMQEKAQLAIDYVRAECRAKQRKSSSTSGACANSSRFSTSSSSAVLASETPEPITTAAIPSPAVDGTAVRDIAVTVSTIVGNMAIEYWKFKSYHEENQRAESRLRILQEQNEALKLQEDTRKSRAMWSQLTVWSLTTAAKFWTDYTMKSLDNQNARTVNEFQAIRQQDKENRRSERFDQFLLWGGKAALQVGSKYLIKN